jgi:hypothetical protein
MQIDDWIVHNIPEHIISQASDWIIQLDRLEQDESYAMPQQSNQLLRQQFYDWLNQDQLNQLAFLQLSEMWAKSSMLRHLEHLIDRSEVIQFPGVSTRPNYQPDMRPSYAENGDMISAPAWMYPIVIGLVVLGSLAPILL